jgi:hypothetical protein
MGEDRCIHTAADMLNIDPHSMNETHPDLYDWLVRVNKLCRKAGGELVSRQAIAVIVDDWQVRQSTKPGSPG